MKDWKDRQMDGQTYNDYCMPLWHYEQKCRYGKGQKPVDQVYILVTLAIYTSLLLISSTYVAACMVM